MLPTEKASELFVHKGGHLCLNTVGTREKTEFVQPQHIYILSNDVIKSGDWVILGQGKLHKMTDSDMIDYLKSRSDATKKIIASTDKRITPESPIPKLLVDVYITFYNKADENIILQILVEYEETDNDSHNPFSNSQGYEEADWIITPDADGEILLIKC